jgi:hypothetical protein
LPRPLLQQGPGRLALQIIGYPGGTTEISTVGPLAVNLIVMVIFTVFYLSLAAQRLTRWAVRI